MSLGTRSVSWRGNYRACLKTPQEVPRFLKIRFIQFTHMRAHTHIQLYVKRYF